MQFKSSETRRSTRAFAGAVALFLANMAPALAQQIPLVQQGSSIPPDFAQIVRQKAPAVVAITTKQMVEEQPAIPDSLPFGDLFPRGGPSRQQSRQALGSGFVIRPDGYIITNNHVIENATEIHVIFADRTNVPAQLTGRDPATDVAVLKIDPRPGLQIVSWGNSDAIEPGAWTIAIGSPFGLGGTVTVGVISARSRDIHAGPLDDFLQTDASINQGNSGGPLFNAQGEVIGVNTAIFSPSGGNVGIGFAVPSRTAQSVSDQLIRSGRVERGYLGVRVQEITPGIAQALGLKEGKGAVVAAVEPGSPAEKAGIKSSDVIIRFGGKPVDGARDLTRAVSELRPGAQITLSVYRSGNTQDLVVTVGQRTDLQTGQDSKTTPPGGKRLGVALAPIPETARRDLALEPGTQGVLVQQVEPNSPAAENGIKPGDIIVSANNRDVSQPSDVAEEWAKVQQQQKPILLRVRRDGQYLYVAVG
jgi:serine protease Do